MIACIEYTECTVRAVGSVGVVGLRITSEIDCSIGSCSEENRMLSRNRTLSSTDANVLGSLRHFKSSASPLCFVLI